jgi:hypothetical protein
VHHLLALQAAEGQREDLGADQDEHHHGRDARRRAQRLDHQRRVSRRPSAQTTSAPSEPIAAASVGAAMPAMMEPSTAITSPTGGAIT